VANKIWAAFAASGVVLGAAYMLWLYQRTMFGKIENPKNENLPDLNLREFATFVPLLILAVWIGLYPAPILRRLDSSVTRVVARVNPAYNTPQAAKRAVTGQVDAGADAGATRTTGGTR
jgi:NADH-quinone oxidoreductase subunit M